MKKVLFSATMREISYLLDNDYLNEKGKEWTNSFKCEELSEISNSPQCPTVCVPKKEGGNAQWVHNQPHHSGEMEQLDADGSSAIKSKRGWGRPYGY